MKESHLTAVLNDLSVHYGKVIERTEETFTIVNDISGTGVEEININDMMVGSFDTMDDDECLVFEKILKDEA